MSSVLFRGGTIVTQNDARDVFVGDLLIENSKIKKIAKKIKAPSGASVVDAADQFVIPGFVQTHTHLCQALFRGYADDLSLLDWLRKRIWPFESSHNEASLRASARIGLMEMQLLGTTAILDMGTVQHTEALLDEAAQSGMRYWGGKCLMDLKNMSGPLYEEKEKTLRETKRLLERWHHKTDLIRYAICPRFAVSCSDQLMRDISDIQTVTGVHIHTHASESREEVAVIRKRTGLGNVDYFARLKMLNPQTVLVHGVHMSKSEMRKMVRAGTPLTHCPSSNLKLASGIAPIETYLNEGLKVGLGSDGAPCNNTMDPFLEMRLAALLQKPAFGPKALPAPKAFDLANRGGAAVLGMESEIGSLEPGKFADVVTVDRSHPNVATVNDPYSALVYSASGRDVVNVMIHGRFVVKNRRHQIYDESRVIQQARKQLAALFRRVRP